AYLFPPRTTTRYWMQGAPSGDPSPNKSYNMLGMSFRRVEGADGQTYTKWLDVGENPPNGVIVYYSLPEAAGDVALAFLDKDGNEIKRFVPASSDEDTKDGSNNAHPELPAVTGLNRFVWDMRYADAYTFEGAIYRRAEGVTGPLVPPGTYTAKLQI